MTELYRYETEFPSEHRVNLKLRKFTAFKETPCGYWVLPNWVFRLPYNETVHNKHKRWVSKSARKRYCYPTQEEAFTSFQARQRARLRHARRHLAYAEMSALIQEPTVRPDTSYRPSLTIPY